MSEKIAVIFGGVSNENEISVITGTMAANVLKGTNYDPIPVYIAQNGDIYGGQLLFDIKNFKGENYKKAPKAVIADGGIYLFSKRHKIKKFIALSAALNCCHGGAGEGGGLCGVCEMAGIPLAGAGIFESAAFMDKYLTKIVLKGLDVKTAEYEYVTNAEKYKTGGDMPQFPLIVKPVNLGSSIGIERVENLEELESALKTSLIYDSAAIVEKYFEKRREINCAAYFYDGEVITSECEEALTSGDILSFEDKYQGGGQRAFPANLPHTMSQLIKNTTKKVYSSLNMRGIVRFDFIVSGKEVYLSEINTVPGSLSYYLLSKGFKDFYNVLDKVICQAQTDFKTRHGKKLLRTGILESIPAGREKLGTK
ncbi:MAG: ATP-grasp domain-containing protein [Clostridiales bacterium]|nr:ATP-grasp domain-containing protein [Clostridiales bacterium]